MSITIAPYDKERYGDAVFRLWQTTIGQLWPLDTFRLRQVLSEGGTHFIALEGDKQVVGFVATHLHEQTGHISLLLVASDKQRQGIGTALHNTAVAHFREAGATEVQLGGGSSRFFPGVPENLPDAVSFFRSQGWSFGGEQYHVVYDLAQDLRTYVTPSPVLRRVDKHQIYFETIVPGQMNELLAFESREFPEWLDAFQRVMSLGDYDDVLVGRNATGQIVASLIMYSPQSSKERHDVLWQAILGERLGAIGCVGVAEQEQGKGIGLALVACATELLIEHGVEHCSIDWVVLIDFYAKLGYHVWRGYHMCSRYL
ncbi:MAG TPA: hypothetical protein DHW02_07410 [Ktedonobacter sp.]|nr:hypothetical protein [Ktedonobacter sp.]